MSEKKLPFDLPIIALAMSLTGSGDDEAYGDFIVKTFNFGNPPKKTHGVALFQNEDSARMFLRRHPMPGKCHILAITSIETVKHFLEGQLTNGVTRLFIDPIEQGSGDGLSIQTVLNDIGK